MQKESEEEHQLQNQNPIQESQQKSKTKFNITCSLLILFNLIIGFYFVKYSRNEYNEVCFYLGGFSYYHGIVLILLGLYILFIICPCECYPCINKEYSSNMFGVILSVEFTQQAIFLTALTIVYFYQEPCGLLVKFVLIYLIINLSLVFFSISVVLWIAFHSDEFNIIKTLTE
ncbi:unnamed protein product [Paramecium primaurelia]|uniref:Transmembrane protein n=1 Tax=Paramecium primaurelia TaxID=5886 RepID=A0A8S1KWJ9_PARPR|nr:unnamed protein product [Paramecium primaurelia]